MIEGNITLMLFVWALCFFCCVTGAIGLGPAVGLSEQKLDKHASERLKAERKGQK